MQDDNAIRDRAYHLWLDAGRPHGRDAEFWERASTLIAAEAKPAAAASKTVKTPKVPKAAASPSSPAKPAKKAPAKQAAPEPPANPPKSRKRA